jgi:iron complex outermembrane receptor protein
MNALSLLLDPGGWFGQRPPFRRHRVRPLAGFAAALLWAATLAASRAAEVGTNQMDLAEMPLEKLMTINVTSVSKKAEKLSESPAAISVLTQDDIRRSGATSLPEALRLIPGLDVAQVDSQQWAISARGFNDVFANKLLVLQDGRSIYTPLFSGVFWQVQDTLMEDIDRIEVIRGPGASLWGANAVNGVINIITKSAKDTQGILITGGGGTEEPGFGGIRYGGKLAEDVYFRVYGKYFYRDDSVRPDGSDARDAWQKGQGGFRIDWDTWERTGNLLTLQGDIYGGRLDQTFATYDPTSPTLAGSVSEAYRVAGGNVLGRWSHEFSETSDFKLQMYYDRTELDPVIFRENRDTYDVDAQHHFTLGRFNDVIWGLGYRLSADRVVNSPTVSLNPDHQTTQLFSAFAQDEITLIEKRLQLTLGARFEHNDYTGFEVQPNGRLLWTPGDRQTIWASISRAVRTPSEAEENIALTQVNSPGSPITIYGNRNFESEELMAYEIGYRVQPCTNLSLDLTAFYNVYHNLRSEEFGPSPTQPPTVLSFPLHLDNKLRGDTYGVEFAPAWQVTEWWRLQPAYTLLKMEIRQNPDSTDPVSVNAIKGQSPQQQFSLRSAMDLPGRVSLDGTLRYVDRLPGFNINSYFALDLRLAWMPHKNLELAVVGQNLISPRHAEFFPTFINSQKTEVPRSVYGKVTWRF